MAGEISPDELEEMESIFVAEPERRADYENLKNLKITSRNPLGNERRAMEQGIEKFDKMLAGNEFTERLLFTGRLEPLPRRWPRYWWAAAVVIPVLAASVFTLKFFKADNLPAQQVIAAGFGKRIQAMLPDGSTVWINSGSSIKYSGYAKNGNREATLNGEAYFDVKHDAKHPFIVHAGRLNVVVLGTAFNVKAYSTDGFVETTLIRGKVEILNNAKPGAGIVLYPNQKVRVDDIANIVKKVVLVSKNPVRDSLSSASAKKTEEVALPDESIDETAWVSNKLTFKREDFSELAVQLERWYGVTIVFDNDKYLSKQFTGTFKNQDINEVMLALKLTQPFHYTINNNQIHIW